MAGIGGKIKASTLLEVIVAMVVILIVFVLATGIYANVMGSSPSVKQQQVKALMSGLIVKSITDSNWNDEEIMIDSISLIKKVLPYQDYADLKLLEVNAYKQNKEVGNIKRIVKMEGEL
jgi:type II secretory pathway pseudopilin PulG